MLDTNKFASNCKEFKEAFRLVYKNFELAYPYKANYLPAVCRAARDCGAYAEVSSGTEYELAKVCQVEAGKIIVNGPFHTEQEINLYLQAGSVFIVDNFQQLQLLISYCQEHPDSKSQVGLRINFELPGMSRSRFGIPEEEIPELILKISGISNLNIKLLHCHFSFKDRSVESFQTRVSKLLFIRNSYFREVKCINIGGGFFGRMPESLKNQFNAKIPDFTEYARGIADELNFGSADTMLMAEPGAALVADCMSLVCKVIEIKKIGFKNIVITDASRQNLHPGYKDINLPMTVLYGSLSEDSEYDITGYTCMESDVLYKNYRGSIAVGDLLVFSNCGAYSYVNKPPFIRPQLPVYEQKEGIITASVGAELSQDWIKRLL